MILVALLVLASVQVALFEEYIIPDNIDIDDILKNDRLLKNYVNCVLDKGNCTPEGERLKSKSINWNKTICQYFTEGATNINATPKCSAYFFTFLAI
jgi:hypothetical protein